jgi:hypothetical protein
MKETSTRAWARPHDWAEVVLGVVAALSPIWVSTSNAAMWTMIVLGVLVAVDGLASLTSPGMVYGEGIQIVLGVLLFLSPWVMGYSGMTGAAWTSWIVGGLTALIGAAALPVANAVHAGTAGQH